MNKHLKPGQVWEPIIRIYDEEVELCQDIIETYMDYNGKGVIS